MLRVASTGVRDTALVLSVALAVCAELAAAPAAPSVAPAALWSPASPHANSATIEAAAIIRLMVISARNISQTYQSGGRPLTVLHAIDLDVAAGEKMAIVGPSGSGKTTLLGLLAGLDRPATGSIHLLGRDLAALDEDGRARFRAANIGFVFQAFQLIPTLTAIENVLVPLELSGSLRTSKAEALRDRANALLTRVGLGDRTGHYPAQLSGGEQQRVALARAFAGNPKILFADEPTGNLDADTGSIIIELMMELNEDAGTTLVLVTHDLDLAHRMGRTVRLANGRVAGDG
jgi:putative ABC transport system ATP-binding protein